MTKDMEAAREIAETWAEYIFRDACAEAIAAALAKVREKTLRTLAQEFSTAHASADIEAKGLLQLGLKEDAQTLFQRANVWHRAAEKVRALAKEEQKHG